jgi:membrane protein DedA with SNARE-associated domain/membrane-associated phospholipid phosphatase
MKGLTVSRRSAMRIAIAALVIAFIVFHDKLPHLDLENLIQNLSQGLGAWTYLLVAVLAFLETGAFVGLIAPGEFTILLGGAVAGQGDISLPLILAITWLAAFLGDTTSFIVGAKLGRGFLIRHGERVRITEARLHQVESYFQRHGGKTIVIGRFIGLVRALAPFIAGTSKMRYGNFAPYSIVGTGLWAATFILIGYFASQSLDQVANVVGKGLVWFAVFVGVVVGTIVAVRYLREPRNRARLVAEMERRRALRPLLALARRLSPQARFLWGRLTPGGLGLEFTTLMAVLSVGLFVLISYWSIVAADPGPTAGDSTALDVARDIDSGWLVALAKAITRLGSLWIVGPLALAAAVALAARRRWAELVVLVAGMALIIVFTHEIKAWTERPRPPGGLAAASGWAFPSGHAAYATFYSWLAVTIAFRIDPGIARRSLLIAAGFALTAVIGLTRVYLQVHWLSDVTAGWALGASAFALVAALTLLVSHIRDNPAADGRSADRAAGATAGAGH